EGEKARVYTYREVRQWVFQRVRPEEGQIRRVERAGDLHWPAKVGKAPDDHPVEFATVPKRVISANVAPIVLYLLIILVRLLRSQQVRSFLKLTDTQEVGKSGRRQWEFERFQFRTLNPVVKVDVPKSQRVRQVGSCHIKADGMHDRPVDVLKRRGACAA